MTQMGAVVPQLGLTVAFNDLVQHRQELSLILRQLPYSFNQSFCPSTSV